MDIPQILQGALEPIDQPEFVPRSGSADVDRAGASVDIEMQIQSQTNWCWSAVSVSVSKFFDVASVWNQCDLVNQELSQSRCCIDGASAACNRPWYLDRALRRTGNLQTWSTGTIPVIRLIEILATGCPVGARVGWSGGGGHFVAISSCVTTATSQFVVVEDPWHGQSTCEYSEFVSRYKGSGAWTHTYLTKEV